MKLVGTAYACYSCRQGLAQTAQPAIVPDPKPPGPIQYINPNPPKFKTPEYQGESYEALVPATLDLAERARLAINAATGMLNPNSDYQLYFSVHHMADPPVMVHTGASDLNTVGKFLEVIPLLRTMCGSQQGAEAERGLLLNTLREQGPDGMLYLPVGGRPYVLPEQFDPNGGWPGRHLGLTQVGHIGYGNCRSLGALCIYAQKDPPGPWKEAARHLAEAFKKTIIVDKDIAYNFKPFMAPEEKVVKPERPPLKIIGGMSAWVAQYLVMYDRALGDAEATQLAAKMMRYNMGPLNYFDDHGRFLDDVTTDMSHGGECAHFHSHATNILAALSVVGRLGDKWMLERALAAYEWGKTAEAQGNSILGYFPEVIFEELGYINSEICEVSDMILAAIMLSRLGVDRWDDADRWVRNQLAESQLTSTVWRSDGHIPASELVKKANLVEGRYTTDRVLERTRGAFSGWPSANDWVGRAHNDKSVTIMNCCSSGGMRALYYVWRNTLDYESGKLRVNLLLNRASLWADVASYIPYEGRVEVNMKQGAEVEVRIPEWAPLDQVQCQVDDQARKLGFKGRYARAGRVEKGQTVTVRFPIQERTDTFSLQGTEYKIVRRGNDVVWIDPPGRYSPFYQRGHYRTVRPLYRKVVRFVSDEDFGWW
jgi:hypothetical protein